MSLLSRIKQAAPRWIKEVAKDPKGNVARRLSGADLSPLPGNRASLYSAAHKKTPGKAEALSAMPADRPVIRRLGDKLLGKGVEKEVHQAFGDRGLGQSVVTKRITQDMIPGSTDAYYDLAKSKPEIFNSPLRRTSGKGWIEPRVEMVDRKRHGFSPEEASSKLQKQLAAETGGSIHPEQMDLRAGVQFPNVTLGGQEFRQIANVHPAVTTRQGQTVGDLHGGNVAINPRTGKPVFIDALIAPPAERFPQPVVAPSRPLRGLRDALAFNPLEHIKNRVQGILGGV